MITEKYIVLEFDDSDEFSFGALGGDEIETKEVEISSVSDHNDLRRDPRIKAFAPMMEMKLVEPMDIKDVEPASLGKVTWGVKAVKADKSKYDGEGVTVAVLDTGIDIQHPAFKGVNIERQNFTTSSDEDEHGHGTHCAGTIFGQDVDGTRIGIARKVDKALIGKVLGEGGSSIGIIKALQWALNQGAHVISMSLGIDFPGYVNRMVKLGGMDIEPATSRALEAYRANVNLFSRFSDFIESHSSFAQGTVIVAAAGNESKRPKYEIAVSPPAAGDGVISVAALQDGKQGYSVAKFSNINVSIAGPGVNVESAWVGGVMKSISGTSMATPHVAGVAALWSQYLLDRDGEVDTLELTSRLIASGTMEPLANDVTKDQVGAGIVQAP